MKKRKTVIKTQNSKIQNMKTGNTAMEDSLNQKVHQEALSKQNDEFQENRKKLQDETQSYKYSQSSKFSSVSRSLVFGILGTIWVVIYSDDSIVIPNDWLLYSLFSCLAFLFADVFHYFLDSISYQNELSKLDKYTTQEELDTKHEKKMDSISKRSHLFIKIKFVILFVACLFFVVGILSKA